MRARILLITVVAVLTLAATAFTADVTGKWVAQSTGPDGSTSETTFNLKVEGTALTGTVTTTRGESTISEGTVSGDEISFVIIRKRNEIEMKTLWKGKVAGDEITFTREFQMPPGGFGGGPGGPGAGGPPAGGPGGPGAGGPGGGGPGGGFGGPPQPIVAKRAK